VVELPVAVDQGKHQFGRGIVDGYADHDAVDGSLPLDLDPVALATR
jgi:hypothetical protein